MTNIQNAIVPNKRFSARSQMCDYVTEADLHNTITLSSSVDFFIAKVYKLIIAKENKCF